MEQKATRSAETRLAELLARARTSAKNWNTRQARELACAVIIAGDTFYVRRVLQRLERGELDIVAARHSIIDACFERVRRSIGASPHARPI